MPNKLIKYYKCVQSNFSLGKTTNFFISQLFSPIAFNEFAMKCLSDYVFKIAINEMNLTKTSLHSCVTNAMFLSTNSTLHQHLLELVYVLIFFLKQKRGKYLEFKTNQPQKNYGKPRYPAISDQNNTVSMRQAEKLLQHLSDHCNWLFHFKKKKSHNLYEIGKQLYRVFVCLFVLN